MENLIENLMKNLVENLMENLMANNQEDLDVFSDDMIKTKAEQCGTYTLFHGPATFFIQSFERQFDDNMSRRRWTSLILDEGKSSANLYRYSSRLRDLMIMILLS